jgi:putative addiction module component (TIGR02574 family)
MLDYDTIAREAMRLPVADRLRLIDQLVNNFTESNSGTLSDDWLAEIDRRSREIDSRSVELESWDSVRTRLLNRAGGERAS